MNPTWTETELAYLAGIVDGEGCISISTSRKHEGCRLEVVNTDPRLIEWIHERFGGTIRLRDDRPAHQKSIWYWFAGVQTAADILLALLPYLVIKRAQATLLLEYRVTVNTERDVIHQVLPNEVRQHRAELKSQLMILNRKGVAV